MINPHNINKEWILSVANSYEADPILVEKVIFALRLLEGLVINKVPFVFKGGTALMLHQGSVKRLSIDIDIMMEQVENQEEIYQNIVSSDGFIRYEIKARKATGNIAKEHIKFYYTSQLDGQEQPILLDILFEDSSYQQLMELPIDSPFVPQKGDPIAVKIPSQEDLLGDKLTAFAPNTTGIPYQRSGNSMSMEIIKQLYDIGNLFDEVKKLTIVQQTFEQTAQVQLAYRALSDLSSSEVLEDIQQTALCIISKGKLGKGNFEELQAGIKRVKHFIHSENYHIELAIVSAAKAAYLAAIIKNAESEILRHTDPLLMTDWHISNPDYNKLNKLKKSNPEAFFYVYQMLNLKNELL